MIHTGETKEIPNLMLQGDQGKRAESLCRSESEGSKERFLKEGEIVGITNMFDFTERRYRQPAEIWGLKQ